MKTENIMLVYKTKICGEVLLSNICDKGERAKLKLLSMDNFSLTKINCHKNFGNEFAFTHSKVYLFTFVTDF